MVEFFGEGNSTVGPTPQNYVIIFVESPSKETKVVKTVSVAVQTAMRGDSALCMDLEPFEKSVERFRRQHAADRKWLAEHPGEKLESLDEINKKTAEKVRKILGKKIVKEFEKGN